MSRSRSKNPNATGKTHIEAENPARPWLDATQVKTPGGSLSDRDLAPLAAPPSTCWAWSVITISSCAPIWERATGAKEALPLGRNYFLSNWGINNNA